MATLKLPVHIVFFFVHKICLSPRSKRINKIWLFHVGWHRVPDHLMTKETCIEAVRMEPRCLADVPDQFKTQEMCDKAVAMYPYSLEYVPDRLKTEEMCEKAVEEGPWLLEYVPDHFKTQ